MPASTSESSSDIFDQYARYYDLLYRDKDYATEAQFVSQRLEAGSGMGLGLLELGCGTGRHTVEFARLNWTVEGVDLSREMILCAQERARSQAAEISAQINFRPGDVRYVRTGGKYRAVISLF